MKSKLSQLILMTYGLLTTAVAQDASPANDEETWRMAGLALGPSIHNANPDSMGLHTAEVVDLPSGGYRMYYAAHPQRTGGMGDEIEYAESKDGNTWRYAGIALTNILDPNDPEFAVGGPSIMKLSDGRWRIYYQANRQWQRGGPNGPPRFQLMSAISSDGGRTFEREGVRISNSFYDPSSPLVFAGHGRVIKLNDQSYVAYLGVRPNGGKGTSIYRFLSEDGLHFHPGKAIFPDHGDPVMIKVGDVYRLYAGDSRPNRLAAALVATSSDGIHWTTGTSTATFVDEKGTKLGLGPFSIGDIGGIVMDGKLRLFTNHNFGDQGIAVFDLVAPPPAGTPAKPSSADRLKQLKDLLDQGLINQDEYDQKKKEIIDSM